MKNFSFVVLDDSPKSIANTLQIANQFNSLHYFGMATNATDGIDIILEKNPDFIILQISSEDSNSDFNLAFIDLIYKYIKKVPKVLTLSSNLDNCFNAIKYGVFDYFVQPLDAKELRKSIFRLDWEINANSDNFTMELDMDKEIANLISSLTGDKSQEPENVNTETASTIKTSAEKLKLEVEFVSNISELIQADTEVSIINRENSEDKPLIICVKSYGDYRYIDAKEIYYLQADNNSTDIHLKSGEMITAFKTLKHFESVLSYPFVRIHNSYIVNMQQVSRIHTGNSVCYIKNTTTKVPFSKSYKENVDAIITAIASGNYLEI